MTDSTTGGRVTSLPIASEEDGVLTRVTKGRSDEALERP